MIRLILRRIILHNSTACCVFMKEVVFVCNRCQAVSAVLMGFGFGILLSFIPCGWFLKLLAAIAAIVIALIVNDC